MTRLKIHAKRELSYDPQTSGIVWAVCYADVAHSWSWADILNNSAVLVPDVNPWNERLESK